VDDDNNSNIFQLTTGNIEVAKDLVKIELLAFWPYQLDVKEIKCPL
jgi:hypothetical protein